METANKITFLWEILYPLRVDVEDSSILECDAV